MSFMLRTQPLGNVDLEFTAAIAGGTASVSLPGASSTGPLTLPYTPSTWDTLSELVVQVQTRHRCGRPLHVMGPPPALLLLHGISSTDTVCACQADTSNYSVPDPVVDVTVRATSSADPFYDGMEFTFQVNVVPTMSAPASSAVVPEDPVVPIEVRRLSPGPACPSWMSALSLRSGCWVGAGCDKTDQHILRDCVRGKNGGRAAKHTGMGGGGGGGSIRPGKTKRLENMEG